MVERGRTKRKRSAAYSGRKKKAAPSPLAGKGIFLLLLIVIILVVVIVVTTARKSGTTVSKSDLSSGKAYLQALADKNIEDIEGQIKALKKEQQRSLLEGDDVDIWSMFTDICIMGDSRAIGFSVYGFLEERRVLAAGGATIRDIPTYEESLLSLDPSYIILCYGLNDISIGYWDTVEEYIAELDEQIAWLNSILPDAVVFVNSTIPAIDPAFETASVWRNIPDWNVAIKAHCEEVGIPYVDINNEVEKYSEYYDVDGIHMNDGFYQYWAIDILTEVQNYENS